MTLHFLALGDSYTIGEGVAVEDRWPIQLVRRLHSEGVDVAPPEIIARTGWTTEELQDAVRLSRLRRAYDLVSLMIGVNDQYRGRSPDEYRASMQHLLETTRRLAGGDSSRVIVLSIPDWSVTPFAAGDPRGRAGIAAEIDRFNAIAHAEARDFGAGFVDVTLSSRRAEQPPLLAADGLHPSRAMYGEWADILLPVVRGSIHACDRAKPRP